MAVEVWVGEERWRIVGVHVKGDMKEKLEAMEGWLEEHEESKWTIIGGDFNARTGKLGGGVEEGEEKGIVRKSKDKRLMKKERN